jgi:outer membrane receptor protein involved in Fe transport
LIVTRDAAGNAVCASGPPCVPYNIFQDGGVTQDAISYLSINGTARGTSTMRTFHADITGELGQYGIAVPTAHDSAAVNLGYERRMENLDFAPDSAEQSGQLAGFGGAPVSIDKSQTVDEEFVELRVPLVQERPWVQDLVFDTGFRHSDYSVSGPVNTHKFELQYAPMEDFRFRGSFQRAIRAPSLIELFNPAAIGLIQFGNDPCAPTTTTSNGVTTVHPPSATQAQCLNTGVTAAQYNAGVPQLIAGQLTQLAGGETTLDPERSNSYTLGLTLTPTFLPNFNGSIDYFHIDLKGGIGTFPANVIMTNCLQTGDPQFCSQIVRNASNGSLNGPTQATGGFMIQTAKNIGQTLMKGVDVQMAYRLPIGDLGNLTFNLNGSYLDEFRTKTAPGVVPYDCAGLFGAVCQTVNPRWHHIFMTSWDLPGRVQVAATWRYMGKVKLDQNTSNPTLQFATFGQPDLFNARIPAYSWLDLSGSWNFRDNMQVRLGVLNVFDKNPPLVTSEITAGGDANTYSVYDQLGRQIFAAVSMNF